MPISRSPNRSMIVRNKKLDLSDPLVMGILNVTPDSFSDGGAFNQLDAALQRIGEMVNQGATLIDVGGESTSPGSDLISEQEELDRVLPVLEQAIPKFPNTFFSVDTTKYRVAEEALILGTHFINDVSGLKKEPDFVDLCIHYEAGYILMHAQGDPKTMQDNPTYNDVVREVYEFFEMQLALAKAKGLGRIIIDPGFGFGKTLDHNLKLLASLREFKALGQPILVGMSRKRMIGDMLQGRPTHDRLTGTVAAHYHAMTQGADIIRVHDVKEAHDSKLVYQAIKHRGLGN